MTAQEPDWVPPGVDTARANPARVYDYLLGGAGTFRSREEIGRFFDGFELVEPGLVPMQQWRPAAPDDAPGGAAPIWVLAGVGRKP